MRILMLPRYGKKAANSRYRLWQYLPMLERAGHQVVCLPMLDDEYLDRFYSEGVRSAGPILAAYLRQLSRFLVLHKYDVVLLDQELFPFLPGLFEKVACRLSGRLIVDYDDAAYWKYRRMPILRRKIGTTMRCAHAVVVGNRHLAQYAERFTDRVHVVPTVVDVERYEVRDHVQTSDFIRICWIGTPITANQYLPAVLPALKQVQKQFPHMVFRVIGADRLGDANNLRIEFKPWSEETEAQLLSECDIGIMPLPNLEFQRAKCGLKLIQYMAAGLPTIGSPVGENRFIVDHARTGFHAETTEQWVEYLKVLITDARVRAQMGKAGRLKAEAQYSLEVGTRLWTEVLREVEHGTSSSSSLAMNVSPSLQESSTRDRTA